MATYGFLDVLEEELEKNFPFDFEISWDKRNHAVEVSFLLEAQNAAGVEMLDEDGEVSSDDILFEEAVLFYNPAKSTVNEEDYLTVIPYMPKKRIFSRVFSLFCAFPQRYCRSWARCPYGLFGRPRSRRICHGMEPRSL